MSALRAYQLQNFKAFAGPERLPIRPITLVYGQNSSGKSSILQSLLLLKQTLDETEDAATLLLPKGNLVDLGGFREFVRGHDVRSEFSFKTTFAIGPEAGRGYGWLKPYMKLLDTPQAALGVHFRFDERSSKAVLASVDYYLGSHRDPLLTYSPLAQNLAERQFRRMRYFGAGVRTEATEILLQLESLNREHPFWQRVYEAYGESIVKYSLPRITRHIEYLRKRVERNESAEDDADHGTEGEARDFTARAERLATLKNRLEDYSLNTAIADIQSAFRRSFLLLKNYLPVGEAYSDAEPNPFTEDWEYSQPRTSAMRITAIPLQTSMLFRDIVDRLIYIGPLRDYPERYYIYSGNLSERVGKSGKLVPDVLFKNQHILDRVNERLDQFGFGYQLKVSAISDESSGISDVFALRLFDKTTGVHSSILDVGFGISQVLPIIVQSMLSRDKVLCIEQPEIHLHPKLQAELGSLLVECIREPYHNTFFIETHSEALILRLQKLIRKKMLSPQDLAVLFVDRGAAGSKCLELRLDDDGDFIDKWPGGFFEEGYREMFE